jgi:hypothetical protein
MGTRVGERERRTMYHESEEKATERERWANTEKTPTKNNVTEEDTRRRRRNQRKNTKRHTPPPPLPRQRLPRRARKEKKKKKKNTDEPTPERTWKRNGELPTRWRVVVGRHQEGDIGELLAMQQLAEILGEHAVRNVRRELVGGQQSGVSVLAKHAAEQIDKVLPGVVGGCVIGGWEGIVGGVLQVHTLPGVRLNAEPPHVPAEGVSVSATHHVERLLVWM